MRMRFPFFLEAFRYISQIRSTEEEEEKEERHQQQNLLIIIERRQREAAPRHRYFCF